MSNPLKSVDGWLYFLGDVGEAEAQAIGADTAPLVVIDRTDLSGDTPRDHTPDDLDVMRGGREKLITSYLSIGEAETYRDYWNPDWEDSPPDWLDTANANWDGNIKVEYWDADWQEIVFNMVDSVVDQGFNGVYLDIIDAFEHFERAAPDAGIDYRAEMVAFVEAIGARADARLADVDPDREFVLIGQNGADLVREDGYLDAIDGIGQEDLRFIYDDPDNESEFAKQSRDDYEYVLNLLERAEDAGTEVFVVEYMTQARQEEHAKTLGAEIADLEEAGIPLYVAESRHLDGISEQPEGGDTVDDAVYGTGGADELYGGDGRDTIIGRKGHDTIAGGDGRDHLRGHSGRDELFGEGGNDKLGGGRGHDWLEGGKGRDRLEGGRADDMLLGGRHDDTLIGGRGDDELSGGDGADHFVFKGRFGHDVITDFEIGIDTLRVKGAGDWDAAETDDGVLIEYRGGNSLEFTGVGLDQLDDLPGL